MGNEIEMRSSLSTYLGAGGGVEVGWGFQETNEESECKVLSTLLTNSSITNRWDPIIAIWIQ